MMTDDTTAIWPLLRLTVRVLAVDLSVAARSMKSMPAGWDGQ